MLTSRLSRPAAVPLRLAAAAATLALAATVSACSADHEAGAEEQDGTEATSTAAPSEPGTKPGSEGSDDAGSDDAAADDADSDGTTSDEAGTSEPDDAESSVGPAAGTLTLSLDGEDTEFTPSVVRCTGEPGTIRAVIIEQSDGELPLVKVTPGEFALVKTTHQGEPEKASSTTDITAADATVTFDSARIGDAVVTGSVDCLQGSQG